MQRKYAKNALEEKERLWQLGTFWMMVQPGQYISKGMSLGGAHGQPKMHTIEGYAFGYTRGLRFTHAHDPTFNGHGGPQVSIPLK
jgi:hypothetical protein